jgi:AcrR family transcriptional regulator
MCTKWYKNNRPSTPGPSRINVPTSLKKTSSESPRRVGRPKSVDREGAIDAAMAAWWAYGLHSMSVNELCRRVGLSKPALYREFGGEDGLMAAALARYRKQILLPILQALAGDAPLLAVLDRIVGAMAAHEGLPAGCLFTRMRVDRERLGEASTDGVAAAVRERRDGFEDAVRRAQGRGEVDPQLSPAEAARYIDAQITLLQVQLAAGEDADVAAAQARLALSALAS